MLALHLYPQMHRYDPGHTLNAGSALAVDDGDVDRRDTTVFVEIARVNAKSLQ